MKKLLSIFGSLGMAGLTGATVVACGDPKKEDKGTTPKEELDKKIGDVEKDKTEIETDKNWGGIVDSVKAKLDESIETAKKVAEDPKASDEDFNKSIEDLNKAIADYKLSLPGNIVAAVINEQVKDTGSKFSKDWTYSSFWNIDGEKDEEPGVRIMDIFYGAVNKKASELNYSTDDAAKLQEDVLKWTQEHVNLVYINVKDDEQAISGEPIPRKGNEDKTIETIFLEKVREEFGDDVDLNEAFWKEHDKLSLGISFDKNATGHELAQETKEFWTFTFGEPDPE